MKKFILGVIAAAAILGLNAEVIKFDKPENWEKHGNVKFVGDNVIEISGGIITEWRSKAFAVDPAKKYVFSAEIRTKPGAVAGICYLGNWSIAKDRLLLPEHVMAVAKSDSKLLEPAVAGSRTVVIAKPACIGSKITFRHWGLAFNSKSDMSDLPNFSYIPIVKGQIDGDKLILTLRRNLPRNYAVDTPVRFQIPHMGMYGGLSGKPAPAEWKKITWTVSGRAKISTNHALRWWQGADKGAIRIIANYNHQKNTVLQVRNVTMTITD